MARPRSTGALAALSFRGCLVPCRLTVALLGFTRLAERVEHLGMIGKRDGEIVADPAMLLDLRQLAKDGRAFPPAALRLRQPAEKLQYLRLVAEGDGEVIGKRAALLDLD